MLLPTEKFCCIICGMINNTLDSEENYEIARQAEAFLCSTKHSIISLESSLAIPVIVEAVQIVCNCNGKIITTGLGKAGHAAAKSSSTLSSLGIPSCYLHPAEASHGDVGIVQKGDVLLAFSTSGKTREVIETIELCKKLGIEKVVSITAHPTSPVRDMSDLVIDMGIINEAGFLSMAPTTSVILMLVVSDMIATICASPRGLNVEEYGLRHHGGYIGKKCRGEEP